MNKLMELYSGWYITPNKPNKINFGDTHKHLRRHSQLLKSSYGDGIWVSPFVYNIDDGYNYFRVLTSKSKHEKMKNGEHCKLVGELKGVLTYDEWARADTERFIRGADVSLLFATPMTVYYKSQKVHFKSIPDFKDILYEIRDGVNAVSPEVGDTINNFTVFNNAEVMYTISNIHANGGTISVWPSYISEHRDVYGAVGDLSFNLEKIISHNDKARDEIDYMMYWLNFIPIGYKDLCLCLPYRADVQLTKINGEMYAISFDPVSSPPVAIMYSIA